MPAERILAALPCVTCAVIESMRLEEGELIFGVAPHTGGAAAVRIAIAKRPSVIARKRLVARARSTLVQ